MKLRAICFTEAGYSLLEDLSRSLKQADIQPELYCKSSAVSAGDLFLKVEGSLSDWAAEGFALKEAILFVGAAGIAVRAISPSVRDKLSDSPVIVMDDMGKFVIPLLSGHFGGANEIAMQIAQLTGAIPVITTATDIHGKFAIDKLAADNGMIIMNREKIAITSAKVLKGECITLMLPGKNRVDMDSFEKFSRKYPGQIRLAFEDEDVEESVDVWISDFRWKYEGEPLWISPRKLVLGIGCRSGAPEDFVSSLADRCLREIGSGWRQVEAVASIDIKKEEPGLVQLCSDKGAEFRTFSAEELSQVPGVYSESDFVKEHTGVGNVCERAAVLGSGGDLILKKTAENGVTVAAAEGRWRVRFDRT